MIARGKREAKLNASPLVTNNNFEQSTESAKYQRELFRSFRASRPLCVLNQGRRASRCSALAPGFHIPRLWRLPPGLHIPRLWRLPPGFHIPRLRRLTLAFIFRAFGACPWPSYSAPSALAKATFSLSPPL